MRCPSKETRRKAKKCANGAISIFLAILLTPFMFVAVMLAEGQKVTSSTSIIDEAMGITSTSVLADYDDYLFDRWGLMAVDQGIDLKKTYQSTLETNLGVLGNTLDLQKVSASGKDGLALNEPSVLKKQVVEFGKFNAPIKVANEALNLSQLISALESINDIDKLLSCLTGAANVTKSIADCVTDIEKLKKNAKKLREAIDSFKSKYDDFKAAVEAYTGACSQLETLKNEEQQLRSTSSAADEKVAKKRDEIKGIEKEIKKLEEEKDATDAEEQKKRIEDLEKKIEELDKELEQLERDAKGENSEYSKKVAERQGKEAELDPLKTKAEAAKKKYATAISDLRTALIEYDEKFNECVQAMEKTVGSALSEVGNVKKYDALERKDQIEKQCEKIQKLKSEGKTHTQEYTNAVEEVTKLNNDLATQKMSNDVIDATKDVTDDLKYSWENVKNKHDYTAVESAKSALSNLNNRVNGCDIGSTTNPADYYYLMTESFASEKSIDEFLKQQEKELLNDQLKDLLNGLSEFIDEMFDVDLFYDGKLSAYIDKNMYDKEYGGLATSNDPGVLDIIKRIGTIVSLSKGYQNGFWNYVPGVNVALRLNDFWKILNECVGLFDDIVKFGVQVAKNIVGLFTSYDRLYYSSYMTYNLPCRVDLDEGKFNCKLMSGYDLNKAGLPKQGGVNNINPLDDFGDDLAALAQTLKDFRAGSGSDITFSGAELEYILFGSNSEIANQLYVFVAFLFCRLLTTIPAVLGNAEAELMAGATTIGYPVVMALLIIGETFVDTLLLVNGENLDFYERTIHLSPSGIVKLTADQLTIVGKKASNALKERFDAKSRVLKKKFEDTQGSERYQELKGRLDKDPYKTSDKSPVGEALESYKKSFGQFSYRDFCLVLLLLTVSENQQMTRLSNLIQMESLWYYTQTEPRDAGFDIRKAYAAIDAQAEVKISWSLPSVTGSSWLTANRRQVRGY